ncbi:hypothetical protein EDD21DRAFT_382823 [Dissophora ornata]|nr:hypothetical protein BGZ58_011197 [Dissophora ornata]KAI8598327.1 hypothetical protein EDD21DRAFT_382823 [Dissophora ornata]
MTSVASPQAPRAPHVKVERKITPPTRATNVVSPASPTQRPVLATNKRYANVQSKVGSLEAINYKPKQSEKKVQSFKHDFSHVKSKVDAKLALPAVNDADPTASDAPGSPPTSIAAAAATRAKGATPKRPTVVTAAVSSATTRGNSWRSPSASTTSPIKNTSPQSTASTANTPASRSLPQSRRSSNPPSVASPPTSPSSPPRRMSKHIIPTQKAQYDHVKSKVGSFDNIAYAGRGRASSHSSTDEGTNGGTLSPSNGRSRSPSALSSTSSTGNAAPTSPSRRSAFKIPASKKVDYSKVRSKVGSLEYVNHTPQGGNLRVFSEKLNFREQAQSKIAKEINIVQFYQSDQSFDTSMQEEREQDQSIIYGSDADEEGFEPPKNILSVLEEVTESVGELGLEEQYEPEQGLEQQANEAHNTNVEPAM